MRPICLQAALSWGKDEGVFEDGGLHVLDFVQLENEQKYELNYVFQNTAKDKSRLQKL